MNQSEGPSELELLRLALEKNIALTEENLRLTKKIHNYITFQKVMSFVYFLIIVVPIVLSVIFLPPLLSKLFAQYQEVLGGNPAALNPDLLKSAIPGFNFNGLDLKNIDFKNLRFDQVATSTK